MKFLLIFFSLLLFVSCSTAQVRYSTTNKKAIKLFEEGQKAPNLSIDPSNNMPNYRAGIEYMDKAIEKDPNFWEAHLLAGEFYEILRDYPSAIKHFEAALSINPNHSGTGSTYFYLANLQVAVGEYEKGLQNIEIYIRNKNANPDLVRQAYGMKDNCEFAIKSLKNPRNFNPVNVGPGINTADPEYFPTITVDGKTILFTRRIKDDRVPHFKQQEDFYISELNNQNIWGTATPMPQNVNTVLNEGAPTIAADGRSLIFVACSDQSGDNNYGENRIGKGSCDMFYTKKLGARWTDPINLPGNVNTPSWESQPSLSADGKTLYFIRRVSKRGEMTNSDIYVSKLMDDGQWGTPIALPKHINTPVQEESVLIHPDGKTLYFASRGHIGMGGSDIYLTRLDDKGNWSKPENLGYPINTMYEENSLMVSPDGEIAYFASDRKGGYGDLDIYYFDMPEEFKPTKTLYFEGIVYDITTRKPVPGKFQLIDLKTGKEVIVSEADRLTGEFMVSLPVNREYALNVSYPGYTFFSQNFNMLNPEDLEAIHMDVPMVPITSDIPTVLANVFFDLGKSTLRPESFVELDKLVDLLVKNSTIKVEIGGHTDTRGDDKDNLKLSTDRAKTVFDYIILKGINAERMSYKGYGETKTVVSDEEIAKLATEKAKEAAHQSNRRTEYKIIK
jgi:outer membrane protein OmpA-like peptidoglycan-associated protein/tetratricopeptide (TPR) repeat protein